MNKEINVGLYGGKGIFGGRETPLEASIITCAAYETCSFYKEGTCLAVRAVFSSGCKAGRARTVRGYTSRAKKYYEFKRNWEQHEAYGKLKHPKKKLGIIGNLIVFRYAYIGISKNADGSYKLSDPFLISGDTFIELEDFTVALIKRICDFRPRAMMGGEIKDYQKEIVPRFLEDLKQLLPDLHSQLIAAYPELNKEIDYVGRKALLKTIDPSYVHYRSQSYPDFNNEWYWDGLLLNYEKGYVSSFNITSDYEVESITLRPKDTSVVEITSNDQVNENTKFVD